MSGKLHEGSHHLCLCWWFGFVSHHRVSPPPLLLLLLLLLRHSGFTSISLRCHFAVTSISFPFHLHVPSNSIRIHFDFISMSLRFHFDVTSMSRRVHFDFTSISFRCHLEFSLGFERTRVSSPGAPLTSLFLCEVHNLYHVREEHAGITSEIIFDIKTNCNHAGTSFLCPFLEEGGRLTTSMVREICVRG